MKKKTVFTALMCTAVIAAYSGITPVCAEESSPSPTSEKNESGVTKDETVYIFTDASGNVTSTIVSDWLKNESGQQTIADQSDLTEIENVKGDETYTAGSDGSITWNADGNDIYYRGNSSKQAPVTVQISYTLDGASVTPSEALGKSGHLKMNVQLTNNTFSTQEVDGTMRSVCAPIVVIAGVLMDADSSENVTCDNGVLQSDAANEIAAAVMLPGMKKCLGSNLTGELSSISSYLKDEFTIEADVTDFKSPTIMMTASTSIDDLKEQASTSDLSGVMSDLDDLQSATDELISGAKELYDGTVKLNSGVSDLQSGASDLSSGLATLNSNSAALNSGAQQIADGILDSANQSLNAAGLESVTWSNYADKISEYLGVNDSMRASAKKQILDSVNASLKQQGQSEIDDATLDILLYMAAVHNDSSKDLTGNIQAQASSLLYAQSKSAGITQAQTDLASSQNQPWTISAVSTVLSGVRTSMANADPTADQLAQTETGILSQIKQAAAGAGQSIDDNTAKLVLYDAVAIASAQQIANPLDSANIANALTDVLTNKTDLTGNTDVQAGVTALETAAYKQTVSGTDLSVFYQNAADSLKAADASIDDSTAALIIVYACENYDSTKDLSVNLSNAASVLSSVSSVQNDMTASGSDDGKQIIKGLLTAAVQSDSATMNSLNSLLSTLNSVKSFTSGLKEYTDGVSSAYSGSLELKKGTDTLKSGSNDLQSGAEELYNGIQKYNNEGISKLTGNSDLKSLESLSGVVGAVADKTEDYQNYSGIADDMDGSVIYIYKVNAAEETETKPTASAVTETTGDSDSGFSGFWSWLTGLFKKN